MAHYGWSLEYLTWGVRWNVVQRMQIDAPGYKSKSGEGESSEEEKPVRLTRENAEEYIKRLNAQIQ